MLTGSSSTALWDANVPYGDGTEQTMTDVVTGDYKRLSAAGHIINNNMSYQRCVVSFPERPYLEYTQKWNNQGTQVTKFQSVLDKPTSGYPWLSANFFLPKGDGDRNALLASLTQPSMPSEGQVLVDAAAKAADTDVLALVSLAEARKTIDSIARAGAVMERISRLLVGKNGFFGKTRSPGRLPTLGSLARGTGNALRVWLEVRYGLLPTYYDILGYAEMAQGIGKRSRVRFTSQAYGGAPQTPVTSQTSSTYLRENRNMTRYLERVVRAGCLVEPYAEELGAVYSLGIDKITSTAWELVPFSFVIDWFLNTSKYIAAHEGRFGQRVLATWSSVTQTVTTNASMTSTGADQIISGERFLGIYQRSYVCREMYTRYVRTANPQIPVLPSVQIRLNWKKALDLVALATSCSNALSRLKL